MSQNTQANVNSEDTPATTCIAVIITAIPVEFEAVCAHLKDRTERVHPKGTVYEYGKFQSAGGNKWAIYVVEAGAGNAPAAVEVERAISYCKPNVVLFVGVAGGLKDVSLGDVVAGTKVYGYESGKEKDGFRPRPVLHESSYRLTQRAKREAHSGAWWDRIVGGKPDPPPRATLAPIAAGEKVVADTGSSTASLLQANYGDALAVEMEGYGFLHATHMNQSIDALVVRGISDLVDGKGKADSEGWQQKAACHASAFCFQCLANLDICPSQATVPPDSDTDSEALKVQALEVRVQVIEKTLGIHTISEAQPARVSDDRLTSDMNAARDLLVEGHVYAAQSQLERLKSELAKLPTSSDLRFRLETNLGAAALMLGQYDVAEGYFVAALNLRPDSSKALANRAQIALAKEEAALGLEYAERAKGYGDRDSHVMSVYLRALHETGLKEKIKQLAEQEPWIHSDAECAFTLAYIAYSERRYSDAERLSRHSLEAGPGNPQTLELLARSIVVPLEEDLSRNPPLPGRIPEDVVTRASEAEALYSEAIERLKRHDSGDLRMVVLANRGMVRGLLGHYDEALLDYDRVLSEDPSQQIVRLNKARVLLGLGRPQEALIALEELGAPEYIDSWYPLATAYLWTDQLQKAIHVLRPRWDDSGDAWEQINIAELLLAGYSRLDQKEAAREIADALETRYADSADARAIVAEWRASQPEELEQAIALFYEALDKAAEGRQKDRITISLADSLFRHQRFSEAADLYRSLATDSIPTVIARRYVTSLYKSGERREALRVSQELRSGGRAIPVISVVEAALLEEMGDIEQAENLLRQLIEREPDNPDHRINLANLTYRRGDRETARQTILGIGVEEVKGDCYQLMALAKARAWLGLDRVLDLAYRSRRLGFERPDIHYAYISIFLHRRREQDDELSVTSVRPGSTIHIEGDHGERKTFTIVEGVDAELYRGELLSSDPVALKLMGRVVGDVVKLRQTDLSEVSCRITKVESQYVFAFQETISNFSTWFPDYPGPESIKTDETGVDKMLRMLDRQQAHGMKVLDFYSKGQLTLGALSQLAGRSIIQTWESLRVGDGVRLIASTGSDQERELELASLASADSIALEISIVLTLASMGLLDRLKQRFRRILASSLLRDDIRDELTLEAAGLRPSGYMYRKGDRYVYEQLVPPETGERQSFLKSILTFLKDEVEFVPTPGILNFPEEGSDNPLGRAAVASILVAKEQGAVLCSDDYVLRSVARNDWKVNGAWSQSLLGELFRTGRVSEEEYHRAVMFLVGNKYHFVRVNEQDYLWLFNEQGMRVTPTFFRAVGALAGPDCSDQSAVRVAGNLIRKVWLDASLQQSRPMILDACVSALMKGRLPAVILSRLEAYIRRQLTMHPAAVDEISRSIRLWKHHRN